MTIGPIKRNYVNKYNNDNNYHVQGRRMFPALTRMHIQTFWTRCRFVMWQRKGVKPVHTKLNLTTPRRLHGRHPAAESWRGPGDDCHKTASQKKGCSKLAAHHCTWCDQADSVKSNVSSRAFTCTITTIITIIPIILNSKKMKCSHKFHVRV